MKLLGLDARSSLRMHMQTLRMCMAFSIGRMTQGLTESRHGIAGQQTPLSSWVTSSKPIADSIEGASQAKQPSQVAEGSFSFPALHSFHLLPLSWPLPAMHVLSS